MAKQNDGPYETTHHDHGELQEKGTYKDGLRLDGPYERYHRNGQLKEKRTYRDGKRDGPHESYHNNG